MHLCISNQFEGIAEAFPAFQQNLSFGKKCFIGSVEYINGRGEIKTIEVIYIANDRFYSFYRQYLQPS